MPTIFSKEVALSPPHRHLTQHPGQTDHCLCSPLPGASLSPARPSPEDAIVWAMLTSSFQAPISSRPWALVPPNSTPPQFKTVP